jgi:CRP-like cAMP-binding protein
MITLTEALEQCDLFNGLPKETCSAVIGCMHQQELLPKEVLFQQGDLGDRFFVVLRGVLKTLDNTPDGSEVVLSLLGPGKSFGEIALLDGGTRSASVQAISHCAVASLDRKSFQNLLTNNPDMKDHIIGTLCRRIRLLTGRVGQLASMDIPARLANVLLGLADEVGSELQGRYYLPVRLAQGDLATMVGASRESVNKFLKLWESNGFIDTVDGRLQILRPKSLLDIAETNPFHS